MEVPAVWTVYPSADREEVKDLVDRLAERLGTPSPELTEEFVLLPPDYPRVVRALDEVDPDWRDKALLIPPVA